MPDPANPLIVQSDSSLLLEVYNPRFEEARNQLTKFAELIKSPEHIHTYQISALSIWNAASSGIDLDFITKFFNEYSKFDIPTNVIEEIKIIYSRFGKVILEKYENDPRKFLLIIKSPQLETEILSIEKLKKYLIKKIDTQQYLIHQLDRGSLKVAFFNYNIPIYDLAGYSEGKPLDIELKKVTSENKEFQIREYQKMAVDAFYQAGSIRGGHGTIVLPCGAGKTIVGIDIMSKIKACTLILATSVASVHQWIREILDKTNLTADDVGEYTGDKKEIKKVTVTTYQILIYRKSKGDDFKHFNIFQIEDWGLIIYDEVHLLPAPVFKITSEIQSKRRLGLTATLVREDGLEKDVFCLIGPKKYDTPWKVLEKQGWIATASCYEIKLPLTEDLLIDYLTADQRSKFNIAAKNPLKMEVVKDIILKHKNQQILIIGHFIDQLEEVAALIDVPLITG
ncbi:MAG: helicase-associated domain-containing protein, partial [Spirochaetes bacterium]|nr:helicase-associated domain-containing protein [Spirochaetota bacterium]